MSGWNGHFIHTNHKKRIGVLLLIYNLVMPTCLKLIGCTLVGKDVTKRKFGCMEGVSMGATLKQSDHMEEAHNNMNIFPSYLLRFEAH